ncbi:MAG TPA: hypothetical protein VFT99_07380, partial [Roseiflexaceae bacterium]|nr:hypothetical protein [Roseiflexaceae bacterium]
MTTHIHPEAQIASSATVGPNNVIGHAIIEDDVVLGAGVVIHDHVRLRRGVRVFDNAVLGRIPMAAGIIQRPPRTDLPGLDIGERSVIGAN